MSLAIFFIIIIKGLKIIAVTKFSLEEAKSFCIWPRLLHCQEAVHTAVGRRGKQSLVPLQFSAYLDGVQNNSFLNWFYVQKKRGNLCQIL